ncbi:uncharacterized protein METZ01_LOCUS514834, partial [marine metagenome]
KQSCDQLKLPYISTVQKVLELSGPVFYNRQVHELIVENLAGIDYLPVTGLNKGADFHHD